jgi:exodeoxyribonuclease VII large subunit
MMNMRKSESPRVRASVLSDRPWTVVPYAAPVKLSVLTARIQARGLSPTSKVAWITAEVGDLRESLRHVFLTLVEHDADGNLVSQVKGVIWEIRKPAIQQRYQERAGMELDTGHHVVAHVRWRFHPKLGYCVEVLDLYPFLSRKSQASRLTTLRACLQADGCWEQNKTLPVPSHVQHAAIIAPSKSASLEDVRTTLRYVEQSGRVVIDEYPATFQGQEAARSIRLAFARVAATHAVAPYDIVIFIRGGGPVFDLAWLNSYEIAAAVAQCPVPVWTGIGHDRDRTILDEVAQHSYGTPSKVAAAVYKLVIPECRFREEASS